MRRYALGVSIVLLMILFISTAAYAAGKSNLILIFDASGSMWGQIDGKAKIMIAKEAMDLIVNDLPADINIGLVAYGHRRKGDCNDVETLIPLGPLNAKAFLDKVQALSPKGKTPMVRSIRLTADAIKHLEDETTILLVSDGEETCDPEPCNFVAELAKLGIKFKLHVVGFDVGGKTEAQLKCMAAAGGGEYFPAKDAGKLKDALNTVIEKTIVKNLKVSVFLNNNPIGASVRVQDPATGKKVTSHFSSEKKPLTLSVKPGTYTVIVTDEWVQADRPEQVFENIRITDREIKEMDVHFGSGTLIVWNYKNGKPFKGTVKVSTMDGKTVGGGLETTYPDKPAKYELQPGKYQITAEDAWGTQARLDLGTFEISSGQTIEKKASFDSGKIIAWIYKNGKPAHGRILLTDANGKSDWYTTYEDRPATITQVPGTYQIVAEDSWGSLARNDGGTVTLAGGQVIEKKVSIDTGKLILKTYRNGKPFHASVIVKDMNGKTMGGGWGTTYPDRPETYTLMPGIYKISAEDSWGDPVVKLKFGVVEIKPGQTLEKICDFDAPKQTARETVTPAAPTAQNSQDMQAMAAQMQANAQAQAAAAQANAMAQMQAALAQMQGAQLPQTPQAGQTRKLQSAGNQRTDVDENPGDIPLPRVPDEEAGHSGNIVTSSDHGAQPMNQVGAPTSTVDYSNVGARDPEAEEGGNPYANLTDAQLQSQYERDQERFKAGNNPLTTQRHISTLNNRLNGYEEAASFLNRNDILDRIDTAKANLGYLKKQLKARADKSVLQRLLDQCLQESNTIITSLAHAE